MTDARPKPVRLTEAEPLEVPCSTCGAAVGEPCLIETTTGLKRMPLAWHNGRDDARIALAMKRRVS